MEHLPTRWSKISLLRDRAGSDDEPWAWFIERYRPVILTLLRRRVARRDVDQAASDFWGYLFQSKVFERVDRNRRFRSYLFGVVDLFAKSWKRRAATSGVEPDHLEGFQSSSDGTAVAVEDEEVRLWATHLLRLGMQRLFTLSPDQARALAFFYGLPQVDQRAQSQDLQLTASAIAERMAKSLANVHQLLTRGRRLLRDCIEREIRETVSSASDMQAEIDTMLSALQRERPGLLGR